MREFEYILYVIKELKKVKSDNAIFLYYRFDKKFDKVKEIFDKFHAAYGKRLKIKEIIHSESFFEKKVKIVFD